MITSLVWITSYFYRSWI